jgi:hypothetical protein
LWGMDNIGEVLFLAKTMELDLVASRPFVPCKYDFIVDNGKKLARVQVKLTSSVRETNSSGDVYVCKAANGSGSKNAYTKEEIDFLAIYCHPVGAWYIIPIEEAGDKLSFYLYPHRSIIGDFSTGMHENFFNAWTLLLNYDYSDKKQS